MTYVTFISLFNYLSIDKGTHLDVVGPGHYKVNFEDTKNERDKGLNLPLKGRYYHSRFRNAASMMVY